MERKENWPVQTLACGCQVRVRPGSTWVSCLIEEHAEEWGAEEVNLELLSVQSENMSCCGAEKKLNRPDGWPCWNCGAI